MGTYSVSGWAGTFKGGTPDSTCSAISPAFSPCLRADRTFPPKAPAAGIISHREKSGLGQESLTREALWEGEIKLPSSSWK